MRLPDADAFTIRSREELLRHSAVFESFFQVQAPRLAQVCHEMSRRFLTGGRLLAFGNGSAATDAQHVSVEFVSWSPWGLGAVSGLMPPYGSAR
jgi:D-sedoheptulose 7-phosphate isomerase